MKTFLFQLLNLLFLSHGGMPIEKRDNPVASVEFPKRVEQIPNVVVKPGRRQPAQGLHVHADGKLTTGGVRDNAF
jgi:hypothetical protein